MMDDFEPISIGISDEESRRREEQQRRDDAARAAALRAMQQLPEPGGPLMDAPPLPRAESVMAEARGEGPADIPPPRPAAPAPAPRERMTVHSPIPQTAADVAAFQRARDGAPQPRRIQLDEPVMLGGPPPPPAQQEPRRIQLDEPVVIGSPAQPSPDAAPEMPPAAMAARPVPEGPRPAFRPRAEMPRFEQPTGNPMQAAARAVGAVQGDREEAGALARWDQRIRTLQQIHDGEQDDRRRGIIAALIANLIGAAGSYMAGGQRPFEAISPRFDALERRTTRRMSDQAREWDATDRAVLRAAELRQGQRAQAMQEQERGERMELQRGQLDIARMREDRAAEQADAQRALTEARTVGAKIEAEQRIAAANPDSDESRRARTRYVLSALPRMQQLERGRSREDLRAELEAQVREMSAYDVERLEGELPSMTIGTRTSRAGGGGGASSGQRSALVAEAVRLGVPEAAAQTMGVRDLQRELAARTRRGADGGEGDELLPGVRAGIDLEPGEARGFRQAFTQMRSQYGALGEIERIGGRYGTSALIDRRAAGEMAAPLTRLRAMVAQLQNTGVINPSEAPAIEAMLPNPGSLAQMTFGDLRARLGSFRGELERAVDAELASRGVDDAGRAAALGQLRGSAGGGRQSGQQQGGGGQRFRVTRGGQSTERELTPEQRRRAEAAGFTVEAL